GVGGGGGGADGGGVQVVGRGGRPGGPSGVEVPPEGALGREVLGEVAPVAAGAEDVEDGVDDVPHVGLAGPPAGSGGREVRRDQGPLLVSDGAGVVLSPHPLSPSLVTLGGQSVRNC